MSMRHCFTRGGRVALLVALALLLVVPAAFGQVLVDAKVKGTAGFGKTVRASATIRIQDGSRLRSVTWSRVAGPPVAITAVGNGARVTLPAEEAYRKYLVEVLSEPPVKLAPPNIPFVEPEFLGGLQDRWQVLALTPLALEEAGLVTLEVAVLTTTGIYRDTVGVSVGLPFTVSTGLLNVPINQPVMLYGKEQASYDWTFASRPFASDAVLKLERTQTPSFVPDAPGTYVLRVTDLAAGEPVEMTIYAGTWRGVVVGQDKDGNPLGDTACTNCHGTLAKGKFEPWASTGHAKVFTDNLNTSDHYGTACLSCHTVGYDPKRANAGIDEAADFKAFVSSRLMHGPTPDNWTMMLQAYPQAAMKANIQCESCHGPQVTERDNTPAHGLSADVVGEPRITLASELCGICHGEPLRHARYQQWQISGHGNYELAAEEGTSAGCTKCHSANGFLKWLENPSVPVVVDWTEDEVHALTCVTCHDPHAVGTTTGVGTDAPMRIMGETPMLDSGYKAVGVGSGAICITCHNSRRGLRNDATFNPGDADRAPHLGTQSDVLMGQNAYLVTTGVRGRHSLIADTCVTCHMEKSKPPAALSMNQSGTNHTFFAQIESCGECHSDVDGRNLEAGFEALIENLRQGIESKILTTFADQLKAGNKISIDPDDSGPLPAFIIDSFSDITHFALYEAHGRQGIDIAVEGTRVLVNGEPGVRMGYVKVLRNGQPAIKLYDLTGPDLPKAFWNYLLIEADGSKGAHNPTWVLDLLNESRRAVGAKPVTAALRHSDLVVGGFK